MPNDINPIPNDPPEGSGGGPGTGDGRSKSSRSDEFLAFAFGLALAFTCMIFYGAFHIEMITSCFPDIIGETITGLGIWNIFLFGFIGGTLASGIYNFLVVQRLNLFDLNHNLD